MSRHLKCCDANNLETVKVLYDKLHDSESLERCSSCNAYWFHRWHEYADFAADTETNTDWYTQLTDEEGRALLNSAERLDLGFLRLGQRPAVCIDEKGAHEVDGQPEFPWT